MLTVGALGVLWATGARAGTLVVTATSPAVQSDARLTRMTGDQARIVSVSAFTDLFDVVSVVNRAADDDCGGRVDLDAWRTSLQEARAQTTMLQTARALSMFAAAEVEAACLDRPPAAVDLVALQLSLADVHGQLADASEDDEERSSHRSEAEAALARAAVFGMGIAAPAGFDSALLAELDVRRDALTESARRRQPRLIFVGQSSGIRLNGRPVAPNEALGGVAGTNLVQVVEAWHLPSADGEEDGRHTIAVSNATLLDERYEENEHAFVILRFMKKQVGFLGQGLGETIAPIQNELNTLLWKIQVCMHFLSMSCC